MSDQSLFGTQPNTGNQSQQSAPAGGSTHQDNPFATLLGGIKNEHGVQKFQSPEDLARGYQASQEFIETLKREKAEAERQLQEAKRIAEETQSQLAGQEELRRTVDELTRKVHDPAATTAAIKPEDIAALVKQTLTAEQKAAEAAKNQAAVVAALQSKFGDKAEEVYNAGAQANGFTVSELNNLARANPKAVLKLLGADADHRPQNFSPVGSTVNTAALAPSEQSFVRRNTKQIQLGATTADLNEEAVAARKMVEELHSSGYTIDDLTKPSVYFKLFNK